MLAQKLKLAPAPSPSSQNESPRTQLSDSTLLLVLIGTSSAFLWFMLSLSLVASYIAGELLELWMYLIAGTLVPILGLVTAGAAAYAAKRTDFVNQFLGFVGLLGIWLCLTELIVARSGILFGRPWLAVALASGALALLGICILAGSASNPTLQRILGRLHPIKLTGWMSAILALSFGWLFAPPFVAQGIGPLTVGVALLLAVMCIARGRSGTAKFPDWGLDLFFLVVLAVLLVSFRSPIDAIHAGFYLAPANEILHGKTLMVDAFGQYGIMPIYLISLIDRGPFPLSFSSLGFFVSVLTFVQYALIYVIALRLLRSRTAAFGLTLLMSGLAVYTLSHIGHSYPSAGPLRFLPPFALLLISGGRGGSPPGRGVWIAQAAVVGVASIWSVETLIYTLATLFGILLVDAVKERRLLPTVGRVAASLGAAVIAHIFLAAVTLSRSGMLPQWGIYSRFLKTYWGGSSVVPWFMSISTWTTWALMAAVYVGSAVALAVVLWKDPSRLSVKGGGEWRVVSGLTFLGIATFSYFVGRSHPWALRHIFAPALLLGAFWTWELRERQTERRRFAISPVLVVFAAAVVAMSLNSARGLVANGGITAAASFAGVSSGKSSGIGEDLKSLRHPIAQVEAAAEAAELMKKYAPEKHQVAVLINEVLYTDALMLAKKGNFFSLSNPLQDTLLGDTIPPIPTFQRLPASGDWAFVQDPSLLSDLQVDYLQRLEDHFCLKTAETTPSGIQAVQLLPRSSSCEGS